MREYVILTDSGSDMFTPLREKYGVEYLPMHIFFKGRSIPASLDWGEYFTERELWNQIESKEYLKASQVTRTEFLERFKQYLDCGKDVLYIACSSALSHSVYSARQAREELIGKYPGAKIHIIDSLNACKAEGIMTIIASNMRSDGKTIDEVTDYIEKNKLCVHQWCTVDELGYFKRAGRITGAAAFFGGILQLKPIIVSDIKGNNAAINKVKGRKAAIRTLVDATKENIINPESQTLYVSHGDCPDAAEELALQLREVVMPKDIYIDPLGPIIGGTTGEGAIAVFFVGKEVTFCKDEKQTK